MPAEERSNDENPAMPLTQAEQDEINNRVLSGDADQEDSAEGVELARLGSYVILEVEEDQHIEKHGDDRAAEQRYDALKAEHVELDEADDAQA